MTSFIANSFTFVSNRSESVAALLATSRPLMNCSIVPVALGTDEIWDLLVAGRQGKLKEERFMKLFAAFSDTMQFTEKIRFPNRGSYWQPWIMNAILKDLIENKRYFTRTIQHLDFPSNDSISLCGGKLLNIRSVGVHQLLSGISGDAELESLCTHFPLIQSLDLHDNMHITSNGLSSLSKLKYLESVDLSYYAGTEADILPFLSNTKRLKKLNLAGCEKLQNTAFRFENSINDVNHSSFTPLLPALEEIDFKECFHLTSPTFQQLQKHAPNLTSLTCNLDLSQESYESVCEMNQLKKLVVYHSSIMGHTVRGDCLKLLSTKLSRCLEELIVMYSTEIDNTTLENISNCSSIKKLNFSCNLAFTDEGLKCLTRLTNLKSLELTRRNRNVVRFSGNIGEENYFSQTLKELTVNCDYVFRTPDSLQSILKSLSLRKLVVARGLVSSEGLLLALETSNSRNTLEELRLRALDYLTDLRFLRGLHCLKILDLTYSDCLNCELMRNSDLKNSSINNDDNDNSNKIGFSLLPASLKELIVSQTPVADEDIMCFSESALMNLRVFRVSGFNGGISDDGVINGISKMKRLEVLTLQSSESKKNMNKEITLEGIRSIANNLLNLKELNIDQELYDKVDINLELLQKFKDVALSKDMV